MEPIDTTFEALNRYLDNTPFNKLKKVNTHLAYVLLKFKDNNPAMWSKAFPSKSSIIELDSEDLKHFMEEMILETYIQIL